ncbi:hypothetical protein GCM10010168_91900 [Actinoplanes ianthinogenes]|uniref:MarR family protein n=1 Tax=Actinoplanes ianthinogenes TaxID=122358 RepID=A0ABN6C5M7_9ACTN|nr:helix-turn-helix domain-containing protein [Actinoplanes ianthinogenes]BCJ40786.1 hypothetical protein Aiant_14430 [Actinoplanes ianthinogenes]GGR58578.1 hypothetical protein GCM10010168_91900 [Actinoplanes ianthinogenes]
MPRTRLTLDDRERIAAWLTDGLGYAEIARLLGRPTSTISREVARNGIPGDYLAGQAHESAARRAPRRRPGAARRAVPEPPPFREEFAALLAGTGMPRMCARVFVCLLLHESGSMTSAELARELAVSPASVSKAIGYLEVMDLIARHVERGSRRQRYLVVDDVWTRAWRTDTTAHADLAAAALRGAEIVGPGTAAGARLAGMSRFFGWLNEQMRDSRVPDDDALTVLAALVHAGTPRTAGDLAVALGWSAPRVASALAALESEPGIADPLALRRTEAGYRVEVRADRLDPAQRAALTAGPGPARGSR